MDAVSSTCLSVALWSSQLLAVYGASAILVVEVD